MSASTAPPFFDNIQRTFNGLNIKFEKPVQDHLYHVYATVGVGLGAAAAGAAIHLLTDLFRINFLFVIVIFGLMLALSMTPHTHENMNKRFGYFVGFCVLNGIGMGPLLQAVIKIDASIVLSALTTTCVVFVCFSFAALFDNSNKFLRLEGFLASAPLALNLGWFFFSHTVVLYAGLVFSCACILYDTQMIVEMPRRGDNDFIGHAVGPFLSLSIFAAVTLWLSSLI